MTWNEPEEVTKARLVIRDWEHAQAKTLNEEKAAKEREWLALHIGRLHAVEVEGYEYYDASQRFYVTFSARLLEADKQEGKMSFDNGVQTTGVWLGEPLPEVVDF